MRKCLSIVVIALGAGSGAYAGGATHVVPNAFENLDGPSLFTGPHATGARTYQMLIHESQLTNLVGQQLTGLTWRLPGGGTTDWPAQDVTYSNYDIYLSGSVDPADRSLTFAENIVGEQTQVRSGPLSISAGDYTSGQSPNDFAMTIGFSNYLYTGGNLLVELRHTGNGFGSRAVDAVNATGGEGLGYGSLFSAAWIGSYDGLSGNQGNFAITQFTSIPTPGAAALLGLAGVAALRRRR